MGRGMKWRLVWGIVIVLLPVTPIEAAMTTAGTPAPGRGRDAIHEVWPGDNLHLIAGYYYGDDRQWERIWQANREQVPDPNQLTRGMFLRVPDVSVPIEPYADFLSRVRGKRASPEPAGTPEQRSPGPGSPRP